MVVKCMEPAKLLPSNMGMVFIKSNNFYYKPHSLPAAGVGGSCNAALLRYKKRRT